MTEKKVIDLFNHWALSGKDIGMEEGHSKSVEAMLRNFIENQTVPFSFIDAGCGNGWLVRKILTHPLCDIAIGVDGASEMIKKAMKLDSNGEYFHSNLIEWVPNKLVDLVHCMEVIYYFENPKKIILHILENWLKSKGKIIVGMDYYLENENCHSWAKDLNVPMTLLSINDWSNLFHQCGLKNIFSYQVNKQSDFLGTLVIQGERE